MARRLRPSLGAEWTKELKSSIEEIVSKALSDQQQRENEKKEEEEEEHKTKSCRRRSSRRRKSSRSRSRSPSLASLIFDKIGVECGGEQCRDGDEDEDCSRQPTPSTSDISKMIEYTNTTGFRTSVADARKVKDKIRSVCVE